MAIEIIKGIRRELRKRQHLENGFTTIPDGYELADIEIVVDMAQIARSLGQKAMANKAGRSRYMHGAVIVNVVRRQRVKIGD